MKPGNLLWALSCVALLTNCDPSKKIYSGEEYQGSADTSYTDNYEDDYYDYTYDEDAYGYEDPDVEDYGYELSPWSDETYRATTTRTHDLIHTMLDVSFDWEQARLNGTAVLTLSPYFYSTQTLVLDAKGMDLHRIALVEGNNKKDLSFSYDSLQVIIDLGREFTREETYRIYIDYTAKPNELPEGGSAAITSDKGLYFINNDGSDPNKPMQIWTQGETEASSCWFPTIDKPNERTTQEIFITVDRKYRTLSNGTLLTSYLNDNGTRTDHWKMDKPHAPYLFMMGVGEFSVVKDTWRDLEVSYYVEPAYEQYARNIFGNTPEMMTFYSELLGVDYPWSKYSQIVVRDYVSGAMENTTATVHGEFVQQTDRELLDESWEDIVSHELFHQWFGDLVTCESWSNLPLNESFATYGEYLWREYKYGREDADEHLLQDYLAYMNEAESKKVDMIRFDYEDKEGMFDSHSYAKGGCILHMLRKYMGDEAFFAGLNKYLVDNQYSAVEIHDLRLAFEEVSGEDLNWFFNQWFLNSGHPILNVSKSYSDGLLTLQIEQVQWDAPVYVLPLDVDIYVDGKVDRQRMVVDRNVQEFTIALSSAPDWVDIDGENMLLAEINYTLDEEEKLFAYANGAFLDRYTLVSGSIEGQTYVDVDMEIIIDALDDPFWAIRELAVSNIYPNEYLPFIIENILAIATEDEKSAVRAAAVGRIADLDIEDEKKRQIALTATADSSYLVMGEGLMLLSAVDSEQALQVARKYMFEKNINIRIAVWEILSTEGNPKDNDYFLEMFRQYTGWESYYLMIYYQEFLKHQTDLDIIRKGADQFRKIGENASSAENWIAFFANSFLGGLYEYYNEMMDQQAPDVQETWQAAMEYIQEQLNNMSMGWEE